MLDLSNDWFALDCAFTHLPPFTAVLSTERGDSPTLDSSRESARNATIRETLSFSLICPSPTSWQKWTKCTMTSRRETIMVDAVLNHVREHGGKEGFHRGFCRCFVSDLIFSAGEGSKTLRESRVERVERSRDRMRRGKKGKKGNRVERSNWRDCKKWSAWTALSQWRTVQQSFWTVLKVNVEKRNDA